MHTFAMNKKGELEHSTDGAVRATIPPEGFDDYVATWPAAAPVVAGARSAAGTRAQASAALARAADPAQKAPARKKR